MITETTLLKGQDSAQPLIGYQQISFSSSKFCRDQVVLKFENQKHAYNTHNPMFSINNTSHTLAFF